MFETYLFMIIGWFSFVSSIYKRDVINYRMNKNKIHYVFLSVQVPIMIKRLTLLAGL